MNSITISGRLTADPELKVTASGKNVTSFNVAVRRTKDTTDFLPCQAWEGRADFITKYFTKGQKIEITGQLTSYKYESNGQNRTGYVIHVDRAEFGESKAAAEQHNEQPATDTGDFMAIDPSVNEELPFA